MVEARTNGVEDKQINLKSWATSDQHPDDLTPYDSEQDQDKSWVSEGKRNI